MLVITREVEGQVCVGDPKNPLGWIKVCSIKGDRVRLGFTFPRSTPVHREEIAAQIRQGITPKNKESGSTSSPSFKSAE